MNKYHQFCRAQQALTLKRLGIAQIALYNPVTAFDFYEVSPRDYSASNDIETSSLFSVAELGIMLGASHISFSYEKLPADKRWFALMLEDIGPITVPQNVPFLDTMALKAYVTLGEYGATEAEARANLLIKYIKNDIPGYSIEEVNERLLNS